jgi:RNA recognition motif-containing protein
MATVEDAEKAVEMYAGYEWNGRKIEVRPDNFGTPRQRPAGQEASAPRQRTAPVKQQRQQQETTDTGKSQLFVGNLPFSVQWQELKDLFSEIGEVEQADVAVGHDGRSRGFGQVIMANLEDAQKAIAELSGADFNGRAIEVRLDQVEAGQADAGCQVFVGNVCLRKNITSSFLTLPAGKS